MFSFEVLESSLLQFCRVYRGKVQVMTWRRTKASQESNIRGKNIYGVSTGKWEYPRSCCRRRQEKVFWARKSSNEVISGGAGGSKGGGRGRKVLRGAKIIPYILIILKSPLVLLLFLAEVKWKTIWQFNLPFSLQRTANVQGTGRFYIQESGKKLVFFAIDEIRANQR